jgi:hypothetical protein
VPACKFTVRVPDVIVPVFAGNVPGPLSHTRVCPFDGVLHENVTVPADTVLGVGLKKSLPTTIVVLLPPPPPLEPVASLQATSAKHAAATIQDAYRM